jgi:hypothetical protein
VPEHPCVSPVSNHVYERRLIEKYIAENGTDPINNQPLSEEQLIDIKGACPVASSPRPAQLSLHRWGVEPIWWRRWWLGVGVVGESSLGSSSSYLLCCLSWQLLTQSDPSLPPPPASQPF